MAGITKSALPVEAGTGGPDPAAPTGQVQLTAEQQRRLQAVQKFIRDKEEAWAKMSQHERDQAETSWERFKNGVNENRAGSRKVFID